MIVKRHETLSFESNSVFHDSYKYNNNIALATIEHSFFNELWELHYI